MRVNFVKTLSYTVEYIDWKLLRMFFFVHFIEMQIKWKFPPDISTYTVS
jgi:hypothetical protein